MLMEKGPRNRSDRTWGGFKESTGALSMLICRMLSARRYGMHLRRSRGLFLSLQSPDSRVRWENRMSSEGNDCGVGCWCMELEGTKEGGKPKY